MKNSLIAFLSFVLYLNSIFAFGFFDFGKVNISTDSSLLCIDFTDQGVGYIGGHSGTLLKTLNDGKTWTSINSIWPGNFNASDFNIVSLQFFNKDTGYIMVKSNSPRSLNYTTLVTYNGGINLQFINTWQVNATYQTVMNFESYGNGVLGGGGFFVGRSFLSIRNDTVRKEDFSIREYYIITAIGRNPSNPDHLMAGTNYGNIYQSFDGGLNWDTTKTDFFVPNSTSGQLPIHSIACNGKEWMIALTGQQSLQVSSDSGKSWKHMATTFAYPTFRSISYSKKDTFVAVGYSESFDKGEISFFDSFGNLVYQNFNNAFNSVAHNRLGEVFAVGDSGQVVTNAKDKQSTVGKIKNQGKVSVYPNPFQNKIHLGPEVKKVIIYNLRGQEVYRTEPDNEMINLQILDPGIYLIQLQNNQGQLTELGRIQKL
jgi:photosystem II stability/assembly factor-like uncharacterized protein